MIILLFILLCSVSYGKTIAFLELEDKTLERIKEKTIPLIISSILPSERFKLIPKDEVNKILTPKIQKELGTITPEIAWTIGELLDCDVIALGSIEGSYLNQIVRLFFIETRRKKAPNLSEEILDLFLSHFGINSKIEKLISQSELVIPLGMQDGIKIGDRFDCIRNGKKIAELEVISQEFSRSSLYVLYAKERILPFDIIRKSSFQIKKTKEFLIINTKPHSHISWKGSNVGKSPIVINDKIEGSLSISKEGFEPLKIDIEHQTYPDSVISITLLLSTLKKAEKRPPSLTISSLPNNCEVFLDGRFIGLTPLLIPNLEERVYEVVVKKEGFSPSSQKVLLKEDQDLKVALYPISLPKEPSIPPLPEEYLSELIFRETAYCLKKGGLRFGFTWPELFQLKIGLPSRLKTELRVFGIGAGLKCNIINWLGVDLHYKAYDMQKREKQKEKGFLVIGSFPSKFFNFHLGLGRTWEKTKNRGEYFLGIERPIKKVSLLAEYENDKFIMGFYKKIKGFEVKTGLGLEDDKILYNLGIYIKGGKIWQKY